ncbi:MAG TPA: DUF6569 family protein [Flavitalea sp.]|nr:DUF6569 family protein [Flavitalea sp.]
MKALFTLIILLQSSILIGQVTYQQVYVDYDSSFEYHNLKIIPVRSKGPATLAVVSLSSAIKHGWVTITERGTASTENVHWLRINNKSNKSIFLSSGEMVTGGRQDRIVSKDTILEPTGRDQYVPAMCVEEGRWSEKEKKFQYAGFTNPSLRKVIDQSKNQLVIWKEIYNQLEAAKLHNPTLAYSALRNDKKISLEAGSYYQYFMNRINQTDSNLVGVICVSGNKVLGADIFAAGNIFYDELPSLLPGYIESAIVNGVAPKVPDADVKLFADKVLSDELQQEEYCRKNGKLFRYKGRVIHVTAY